MKCGLVGPGRTRNGLAPYLATYLERSGVEVVAACGRDARRTDLAVDALERRLGHPLRRFVQLEAMLAAEPLDLLVIASPPSTHLEALRLASDAELHVLCEKPLVCREEVDEVPALLRGFAERGLVLMENCQWPEALRAFAELWPDWRVGEARTVKMRLSPMGQGREMLADSLSHFISVAQAAGSLGADTQYESLLLEGATADSTSCRLEVEFRHGADGRGLLGLFEMQQEIAQPRPAWIEIDGLRADRRIEGEAYAMRWEAPDGRSVPIDDPLAQLVYRFAALLSQPADDILRSEAERIGTRARLYADILGCWPD